MTIYKLSNLTLPPTLEKRREVLEAFRTLTGQDDEFVQRRRAEIAAIRRELEDMRRSFDAIRRQMPELRAQIQRELETQKYSPDQPRVPAGSPHGGEWTSGRSIEGANDSQPGTASSARRGSAGPQYAALETGTATDATPASTSGQYAASQLELQIFDQIGNDFIDSTSLKLSAIFALVVAAYPRPADMTARQDGTFIHLMFKDAVVAAQLTGISSVDVETTFPEGQRYGSPDSIRTNVVVRDSDGQIIAIYDIKAGKSGLMNFATRQERRQRRL